MPLPETLRPGTSRSQERERGLEGYESFEASMVALNISSWKTVDLLVWWTRNHFKG